MSFCRCTPPPSQRLTAHLLNRFNSHNPAASAAGPVRGCQCGEDAASTPEALEWGFDPAHRPGSRSTDKVRVSGDAGQDIAFHPVWR